MFIYHFQLIVKKIVSYVQETADFLRKINHICAFLVSLDVKSLCTNILNTEGIKLVKTSLENYSKQTALTKVITTFLALTLRLNKFIFNCKNYLKIKGYTMEAVCGPLYASIIMDHFQKSSYTPLPRQFNLCASYLQTIYILYGRQLG